jgi:hypothetical protein
MDKASTVHRLDDGDELAIAQSMCKLPEPIEIAKHRDRLMRGGNSR